MAVVFIVGAILLVFIVAASVDGDRPSTRRKEADQFVKELVEALQDEGHKTVIAKEGYGCPHCTLVEKGTQYLKERGIDL